MIRIEPEPWGAMVSHARETYPNECVGAMLGSIDGDSKSVVVAMPLQNAFAGGQAVFFADRLAEFLPLVFLRSAFDSKGRIPPRQ